jgi:hypothetical protein
MVHNNACLEAGSGSVVLRNFIRIRIKKAYLRISNTEKRKKEMDDAYLILKMSCWQPSCSKRRRVRLHYSNSAVTKKKTLII